jgi:integrase
MALNLLAPMVVEKAKGKDKPYLLNDGDRLNLRVDPNGTKTWLFIYTLRGEQKKHTIGKFPAIPLSRARELANECRALVTEGIHPLDAKVQKEAEAKAKALAAKMGEDPKTVADLFQKWEAGYLVSNHTDKGDYVKGRFAKHVFPHIGDLLLPDVRTRHISHVLDTARAQGLTRTCGVLLSNMRQMFVWGMQREWVMGDPSAGLKAADWDGDAVEEERHFDDDELQEFVKVLRASTLPLQWKFAIKLMLAAGTRPGETLNAPADNFDLVKGTWFIPPELQKKTNRKTPPKPHLVDLSPFAIAQIEGLLELYRKKAERKEIEFEMPSHLFPAGRGNKGHADEKTLTKAVYARQLDTPLKGKTPDCDDLKMPGGSWSPQDLRRTTATLMGELGIASDVIDRCQNHTEPNKIKRTYQRQKLRPEMKYAWLKVGEKLADIFKDDVTAPQVEADEEEEDI